MIGNHNNKRNTPNKKDQKEKKKQHQFTGIQKSLQLKLYFIQNKSLIQQKPIERNEENKTKKSHQINNIHFGDDIQQESKTQSIRIFYKMSMIWNSTQPPIPYLKHAKEQKRTILPLHTLQKQTPTGTTTKAKGN